jgi:hypothetical protein
LLSLEKITEIFTWIEASSNWLGVAEVKIKKLKNQNKWL